jgi:DNA ligase (NAD+)
MDKPQSITVKRIKAAKAAYFNTGVAIMADDEYDAEEIILGREEPEFVNEVGAMPDGPVVPLPVPMPSLDKVKPGEATWARWLGRQTNQLLWSAKLDGISALWDSGKKQLLGRGNGLLGSSMSRCIPFIKGLPTNVNVLVRGELIIRRDQAPPDAPVLRSYVNGALKKHSAEDSRHVLPSSSPIRFVAYRVLAPPSIANLSVSQQFTWLALNGYEVPPHGVLGLLTGIETKEKNLIDIFQTQKRDGLYELDGLVLCSATDKPEVIAADGSNPKDCVAFKMPLAEQCADTTVVEVEWNLSRNGVFIPRIIIEPVVIQGATIRKVTGHNARFIEDSGVGPGAAVRIRRSGDVIPIVDTVLAAVAPQLPLTQWAYDGVHARPVDTAEARDKQLLHALKVLNVKGCGPAAATSLVEAGIMTPFTIAGAADDVICGAIGSANGLKLKAAVKEGIAGASLVQQLASCPSLPNGIGESRIKAFVEAGADWNGDAPEGMGAATWAIFSGARASLEAWVRMFGPLAATKGPSVTATAAPTVKKGQLCLTGFRDETWKRALEAAGYEVKDTVTKKTVALIIPPGKDAATYESTKVAQAQKYSVKIMNKETAMKHFT